MTTSGPEPTEERRPTSDSFRRLANEMRDDLGDTPEGWQWDKRFAALLAAEPEHQATPEVVERAKALLAAATPGPWTAETDYEVEDEDRRWYIAWPQTVDDLSVVATLPTEAQSDAEFIAAAPTLTAALLTLIDQQTNEIAIWAAGAAVDSRKTAPEHQPEPTHDTQTPPPRKTPK